MKTAGELIPWKVTDISLRPYSHFWSFNPSICHDGDLWLCTLRCADYCMEGGATIRSKKALPGESRTKNAMVIFDPTTWRPVEIYKMKERDGLPRASCSSVGYEDIRLFRTDKGGLQGIAASLHLRRDRSSRKQIAEQVLLSFDENYDIVDAAPIRGSWSSESQKNWVPFDDCAEPRFLYAIAEGTLFGDRGPLRGDEALARLSAGYRPRTSPDLDDRAMRRARERAREAESERASEQRRRDERARRERRSDLSNIVEDETAPLRGGTQLVHVGDDAWLGIGHAMKLVGRLKFYYHVWYLVDDRGRMKSASPPMKLAPESIEFAAGLAIDGDRVVVSFGVDDYTARLGETSLSALLDTLLRVGAK